MVVKGLKMIGRHLLAFPLSIIAFLVVAMVLILRQHENEESEDVD